ncbi:MAG: RsfS/YbeB/iojap family protein, partial [Synergistaceae bacterium]|nr:RsfS/YbeB/iojap family protein [Synergistaceae bacterium]
EGRQCKIEGEQSLNWRLIDSGDVVVHVFSHKGRDFYRLERLWEE